MNLHKASQRVAVVVLGAATLLCLAIVAFVRFFGRNGR